MPLEDLLLILAAVVLVVALSARLVKRHPATPVLIGLAVGAALGDEALGLLTPTADIERHVLLEQAAWVVLALTVTDTALQITADDLRQVRGRVARLLVVGMPAMWLLGAAGAWLFLDLPFAVCLLLGAILSPTDPAVAGSIVSGVLPERSLPRRLRRSLQVESAANDGLALPLVLLGGMLATSPASDVWTDWLVESVREVGVALVLGPAIGYAVSRAARWAEHERALSRSYTPLLGPATGFVVLAGAHLLGGSGVLAAFLAGLVVSLTLPGELRSQVTETQSAFTKAAVVALFVVFGSVLPWSEWGVLGPAGLGFAAWILLIRRPGAVALALVGDSAGLRSRAFLGWFGPLGVAGIYYAAYAYRFEPEYGDRVFAAAALAVVVSVVAQGATAAPVTHGYARATGGQAPEGQERETSPPP